MPPSSRHHLTILPRIFLTAVLLSALATAPAAEVSREASAAYREKLAPLLTPRETAIRDTHEEVEKDAPGVTLLEEYLHYVDAQGRRIIVGQTVYKPLTEAGAKAAAEDIQTYRKGAQKFALLVAETIQPDGTVQNVGTGAILVQSPQRQASYALYDDQAEVRTIFPNVKAGCIVRMVFVIEDVEVRMPNEYTRIITWDTGWPKRRIRNLVDLPDVLASRLQIVTAGEAPKPVRETPAKGRVRLTWEQRNLPMGERDIAPGPATQFGPSVHLSTVRQWSDVGRWFNGMVAGRNQLSPSLAGKVDEWTKGVVAPAEIRRILFSKVADDVRYTGLELGAADYQPHDCNEVWANQYGDCKDKANLLAAMLRHKGQEAYVTLLNTEHAGLVDRRVPDYRPFTHAIVAVRDNDGYLFCDPTVARAVPGMLSGADLDRDVLVIKDRDVEWVRTPAQIAGVVDYSFDLTLKPSGELTGWLTFTSSGYYGAYYLDAYQKLDALEAKQSMQEMLREFYPGAELVDFSKPPSADATKPYVLKAYFTIRNPSSGGSVVQPLVFPRFRSWVPNLGTTVERHTPYFQYPEQVDVACRIRLAPAVAPTDLPPAYTSETVGAKVAARWSVRDQVCTGELSLAVSHSLIQPADFSAYYQSIQGLSAWLNKPVVLGAAGQRAAAAETYNLTDDFPLMPSSDGQFDLLEKLFPSSGNTANRRAALQRILQYFPNDRTAAYRAGVLLATMEAEAGRRAEAVVQLRALGSTYRNDVRAEYYAWGQGMEAYILGQNGDGAGAQKILTGLVADASLPEDFRARQLIYCANVLKADPQPAMAEILQKAALWHTPIRAQIYVLWAQVALQLDQAARWREAIAEQVKAGPGEASALLLQIAHENRWMGAGGEGARQQAVLDILAEFAPQLGESFTTELARLKEQAGASRRLPEIQAELKAKLAEPALAEFLPPATTATPINNQDFERELAAAETRQDLDAYLRLCLRQLVALAPDDYFGHRLWRAALNADSNARRLGSPAAENLLTTLLDLGRKLPDDLPPFYELALLRGGLLGRQGDRAGEQAVYRETLARPALPNTFRPRFALALGKSLELSGELTAALAAYDGMEKYMAQSPEALSAVLRAVFLHLHYLRFDQAQELIRRLAEVDRTLRGRAEGAKAMEGLIDLVAANQAVNYWLQEGTWWSDWDKLAEGLGLSAAETPVPVVTDQRAWSQSLNEDFQRGDWRAVYEKFGTIATATRWLPAMSLDLSDFVQVLVTSDRNHAQAFLQLGIRVLSTKVDGPPDLNFSRKLQLVSYLLQAQQADKAGIELHEMRQWELPKEARLVQAYNRVRAACATATGHDRAEASEALAADLASPNPYALRSLGVGILVDLYHAMGKTDAEQALITREIGSPEIKANAPLSRMLVGRLAELQRPVAVPTFEPVNERIKAYFPDWFDYVGPKDLSDPRLRRLEDVLNQPLRYLEPQEALKVMLLVASDSKQVLAMRDYASAIALQQLQGLQLERKARAQFVRQVAGDAQLSLLARQLVLLEEMLFAAVNGDKEYSAELGTQQAVVDGFNPLQHADQAILARWAALRPATGPDLVDLGREIAGAGLSPFRAEMIGSIGWELQLRGDVDSLRGLIQALGQAGPTAVSGGLTAEAMQLEFGRQAGKLEAHAAVQQALAETLLAHYPEAKAELPAEYRRFCPYRGYLIVTEPAPTLAYGLSLLRSGRFERKDFDFWRHIWRNLPRDEKSNALALELVEQGLSHAPTDEIRAELVGVIAANLDWDNPAIRSGLNRNFAKYRKVDEPLTYAEIRFYEILSALRVGDPVDLDTAFAGLDTPGLERMRAYYRLQHFLATEDRTKLKRELTGLDAGLLSEGAIIELAKRGYELLGMTAEAELTKGIIRKDLKRDVAQAWVYHNSSAANVAGHLAIELGAADALPETWVKSLPAAEPDAMSRWFAIAADAKVRQDWPRLLLAANSSITLQPTNYYLYWLQGLALARLGRPAEATAALQVYLTYSRNEPDYPLAVALLAELSR